MAVKAGDARVAAAMAVARVFREGKRILERIGQAPSSYQGLCTFRGLLSDVCVRDEIEACAATSGRTGTDERRCARPQASARRHLLPSALEPKGSSPFRSPSLQGQPVAVAVGGHGRWRHGHHGGLGGGGRIAFRNMTPATGARTDHDAGAARRPRPGAVRRSRSAAPSASHGPRSYEREGHLSI